VAGWKLGISRGNRSRRGHAEVGGASRRASPDTALRLEYTRALVRETSDEIGRADSKAAMLLAGGGVLVGTGTSAAVADAARLSHLSAEVRITLWIAVIAVAVALVFLAMAAYPRTRNERRAQGAIAYFGDVMRAPDLGALRAAIADSVSTHEELIAQKLFVLSRIVARKYLLIKLAFAAFSVALAAGAACVIQSALLH
jgi:hypothetical protein